MTVHFVNLLDALRRRSLRMAAHVESMVEQATEAIFSDDEYLARHLVKRDREVDGAEVEIEAEVIRLMALYQPMGSDLRLLCTVLKVTSDLERVADCAVNIAERAKHLELQPLARNSNELRALCPEVRRILRKAIHAYSMDEDQVARAVIRDDSEIDEAYAQIIKRIVHDAAANPDKMAAYLDMLSVAKNLERIADHATNIAEDVIFLTTGDIVRHLPDMGR